MNKYEAKLTEIYNQILIIKDALNTVANRSYGFAYPCLKALHQCLKSRLVEYSYALNDAKAEFILGDKPDWLKDAEEALKDFDTLYQIFEPKEEYLKTWKNPLKESNIKVKKKLS